MMMDREKENPSRARSKTSEPGSVHASTATTTDTKSSLHPTTHHHHYRKTRTKPKTKKSKYFKTTPSTTALLSPVKKATMATSSKTMKSRTAEMPAYLIETRTSPPNTFARLDAVDTNQSLITSVSKFNRIQASLASNLSEMRRLYVNWQRGEVKPTPKGDLGIHDWALWRTKVNETLIVGTIPDMSIGDSNGANKIEPHVGSFFAYVGVYGDKELPAPLEPEAFMFYGLPRVKLTQISLQQQQPQTVRSINNVVPNKLTIDDDMKCMVAQPRDESKGS